MKVSHALMGTAAATALAVSLLASPPAERTIGIHWPKLLLWNASASAPTGLYLLRSPTPLKMGALVTVTLPAPVARFADERGYLPSGLPLLKHIAALSGRTVCRTGNVVTIDKRRVAIAVGRDHLGRPLPSWSGCRLLGKNEVFLLNSDVAASFDGRYFGIVSASTIAAIAIPIWTTHTPTSPLANNGVAQLAVPLGGIREFQNVEQRAGHARVTSVSPALGALCSAQCASATAVPVPATSAMLSYDSYVQEAATRFQVPTTWIAAVMRVESNGNARAISIKGAMGLMQLMPPTWADLAHRYRLGNDPFDPRDNIFAGTAYLRELYDHFGPSDFLAAYYAGPDRALWGRDTAAYLRRLGRILPELPIKIALNSADEQSDRRSFSLFVAIEDPPQRAENPLGPQSRGLFIALRPEAQQ